MKWTDRIGRRVKLRDLHIALAVAEAGSMTRAAEELAVSYPVVSKTISELEHTLGVKLFDRSSSGVEPTHYGRALLKSGVAVFDEMRRGLQQIEFIKQPDVGELRIGSSIVTDAGLLPAIIERFSQEFPRAVVNVLPENIAIQQYDNLRDRKVELVVGRLPTTMTEPDLIAEPLFDEPPVVVAGAESCWAKRRNLALADLIGEPWVLAQPGSLARSLHEEVFRKSDLEPPSATVVTVSLHLYMRLIETGRWLGLVPASVMRFGGKRMRLKVLPVKTSSPPAPVGFITVKDRTLTPLAERFMSAPAKSPIRTPVARRRSAGNVRSWPIPAATLSHFRVRFHGYSSRACSELARQLMTRSGLWLLGRGHRPGVVPVKTKPLRHIAIVTVV
jgi:DNA-binding transcriptional LysR family regulator